MNQQKQKVDSAKSRASVVKKKASAVKKENKPRKKNPPEHEHIIDAFDAMITFSYAYEWQKLQNNDEVDKLFKLRDLISSHIENEASSVFMTPTERDRVVSSILNKLKQAVKDNNCPKTIDFGDTWLNGLEAPMDWNLTEKQHEEFDYIIALAKNIISSLNSLLDEMKPFVTTEQVDAIFKKSCHEMPDDFTVPIHKALLVSRLHECFLKTFAITQNTSQDEENAYRKLVEGYCKDAVHLLVEMVKENVINNSVIHFFTQAKGINLEIDRYYPWALICYGVMDYEGLLAWYSAANARGLVKDKQFTENKAEDKARENLEVEKILQNNRFNYRQYPRAPKDGIQRYMFDSNSILILIDGKPLHNHLVMALPYDRPISDLQDNLRNYARYLGNEAYRYRHTYSPVLGSEDTVNNVTKYRKLDVPYKRLSLSDASSVLHHICSLLYLQFERSNDYSDKAKKCRWLDAYELIESYGFKYSESSVESVYKFRKKNMLKVVNGFLKP